MLEIRPTGLPRSGVRIATRWLIAISSAHGPVSVDRDTRLEKMSEEPRPQFLGRLLRWLSSVALGAVDVDAIHARNGRRASMYLFADQVLEQVGEGGGRTGRQEAEDHEHVVEGIYPDPGEDRHAIAVAA